MGNKVHKSTRQRFVLFYVLMSFFHPQMLNTIAVLWHWCPSLKWLMQLWCWSFLLRWWLFCVCSLWGVVAIEVWPFFGHWSTVTMRCCGHMCTAVTIEVLGPFRCLGYWGVVASEVLWPLRCCDVSVSLSLRWWTLQVSWTTQWRRWTRLRCRPSLPSATCVPSSSIWWTCQSSASTPWRNKYVEKQHRAQNPAEGSKHINGSEEHCLLGTSL